jgi:hypothetical protein
MNTWTDMLLIIAIVIGLIAAASLPMVSVNAISSDSLRLREDRGELPPWVLTADDARRRRISAMRETTVVQAPDRATSSMVSPPSHSTTTMSALGAAASGVTGVVEALPAALLDPAPGNTLTH